MTLLIRTKLTDVFHRAGRSDFTLITFANAATTPDGKRFWGEDVAEALDLDAIGFVAHQPHWFPESDLGACFHAVAPLLEGRPLVAYGDSMGAYAAIRHAKAMQVDLVIAVSPQASICPADVPDDVRFRKFYRPELHDGMAIHATHRGVSAPIVIYDPRERDDRTGADMIGSCMPIRRVAVPYTGHQTIHMLTGTRMFAGVLDFARKGDVAGIHAALRIRKKTHPIYLRTLAWVAWRLGHAGWAEAIAARAEAAGLPRSDLLRARAEAMLAAGRPGLAEADARAALQMPDTNLHRRADLWAFFATLMRGRGFDAACRSALDRALAEFADRPELVTRFEALRQG